MPVSIPLPLLLAILLGVLAVACAWSGSRCIGGSTVAFDVPGTSTTRRRSASVELVSDRYFATLRIRLLRGRAITADDVTGRRLVAVVNARLVAQHFRGVDPIGRTLQMRMPGERDTAPPSAFQIVGVVADARNRSLPDPIDAGAFLPFSVTRGASRC